jgi:hypothetical protein
MKLPNGDRADLGSKLQDYVLSPRHRRGRHKARVFESALGITRGNQDTLANALHQAAANSPDAISTGDQGFGATFEIRFPLTTDKGTATVLSAWIISAQRGLSSTGNLLYCVTYGGQDSTA